MTILAELKRGERQVDVCEGADLGIRGYSFTNNRMQS
jgi:hypothetical protein